jgi:hypothetical protein
MLRCRPVTNSSATTVSVCECSWACATAPGIRCRSLTSRVPLLPDASAGLTTSGSRSRCAPAVTRAGSQDWIQPYRGRPSPPESACQLCRQASLEHDTTPDGRVAPSTSAIAAGSRVETWRGRSARVAAGLSPVALLGLVAVCEIPVYAAVTYGANLVENTDGQALSLTSGSSAAGLAVSVLAAAALVPPLGAAGALAAVLLSYAAKSAALWRFLVTHYDAGRR